MPVASGGSERRKGGDPPGTTLSTTTEATDSAELRKAVERSVSFATPREEEVVLVEQLVFRGPEVSMPASREEDVPQQPNSPPPLVKKDHVLPGELGDSPGKPTEVPDLRSNDLMDDSQRSDDNSSSAPPMAVTSTPPKRAGAYRVTKIRPPGTSRYKVLVPREVQPGMDFPVLIPNEAAAANGNGSSTRRIQVTCPLEGTIPGTTEIEIEVPHAASYLYHPLKAAQLTLAPTTPENMAGRAFVMLPTIQKINEGALQMGATTVRTQVIVIPDTAVPGQHFHYRLPGVMRPSSQGPKPRKLNVLCPRDMRPGDRIRVVLPAEMPEPEQPHQTFLVIVPDGVPPGGRFAVEIGGASPGQQPQQVLVDCPMNAKAGDTISLELPTRMIVDRFQALSYPTGTGWTRTVRASDLHFQWVRLLHNDAADAMESAPSLIRTTPDICHRFLDPAVAGRDWKAQCQQALVRQLVHLEGNDPRLRTAALSLVPAESAAVPSKLKTPEGALLFSYADIAYQQSQPLTEKHLWFLDVCRNLTEGADALCDGPAPTSMVPGSTCTQSIRILVRRDHLLFDSLRAVLSLSVLDMRRHWKIEFVGESGEDEGGLTKEWFQCLTEQLFLPSVGLFVSSCNNQAAVDLNPVSDVACPNFHLYYYRFAGRVLGRALFSGHLIKGHLVRLLYKYLLGWPVTAEDIRDQDDAYFMGLRDLAILDDENLSSACLDFTVTEEFGDVRIYHELVENGANIDVSRENLASYIEANIRYRLFDRTLPQLTELLVGFYDVVPEEALTVFDANELELLLCGLPHIDLADWKANTLYLGLFEKNGLREPVVQWFWEIVTETFDIEMQARLLQFVTGTSGVPPGGFAALKGGDEYLRKFAIQGVDCASCLYPKAHTCFNVLDIPNYATKEELQQRLTFSITTSFVGFEAE